MCAFVLTAITSTLKTTWKNINQREQKIKTAKSQPIIITYLNRCFKGDKIFKMI